jgi:SAM-dependent methyltransferase
VPFTPPPRRRGHEYLDDPTLDPRVAARSLDDIVRSNALFGGRQAVIDELDGEFARAARAGRTRLSLLDVGAGRGDIAQAVSRRAQRHGVRLLTIGLEMSGALAQLARGGTRSAVAADARTLPFADGSIDLVCCSQLLHHLDDNDASIVVREMQRVARQRVVVADIRRSRLAAVLLWVVSFPLRFHPMSRHDGVLSVFRGYTADELRALVRAATGRDPVARRRRGWRVTASWAPVSSGALHG